MRVDDATEERAVGGWTAERQAEGSWRLDSREGSPARVSQDESDSSSIVEFSLVTHASDSPHMHIVLQYLFSALG